MYICDPHASPLDEEIFFMGFFRALLCLSRPRQWLQEQLPLKPAVPISVTLLPIPAVSRFAFQTEIGHCADNQRTLENLTVVKMNKVLLERSCHNSKHGCSSTQ